MRVKSALCKIFRNGPGVSIGWRVVAVRVRREELCQILNSKAMKNFKFFFLKALGLDEIPAVTVEANIRLGKPFFICKNTFGEVEIMAQPEERNKLFAEIMGARLRYSSGTMVWYDGHDFVLVNWENWSMVFSALRPRREEKVTWGIVERKPRRTDAERVFEDGRKKRADLPRLMRADQIMVLLQA